MEDRRGPLLAQTKAVEPTLQVLDERGQECDLPRPVEQVPIQLTAMNRMMVPSDSCSSPSDQLVPSQRLSVARMSSVR